MEGPRRIGGRIGDRIGRFVAEFWPQAVALAGTLSFAAVGIFSNAEGWGFLLSTWAGRFFVAGVVLTVVGSFATFRRERRVYPLRRRLAELEEVLQRASRDYFGQLRVELARVLGEVLGLGDGERISLYRHRNGRFQLLGRYSESPLLDKRPMRPFYPEDEGVIGAAWRDGRAFEPGLPDPETDGEDYYRTVRERWGVDRRTAEAMTMQARSLIGCAIYEPRGVERVAVVVVESQSVGTINETEVYEAMSGTTGERLHDFLERGRNFEPEPNYAAREDY